jgi:TM2 domain-containing membrane protein YozV
MFTCQRIKWSINLELISPEQSLTASQLLLFSERYNLQKRSLGIALILCLFLGAIGIHRFYLKKNVSGVLYLLFCWSLIPAFLSLIDLFLVPSQVRRYNNLQAVEILSALNPQANSSLLEIFKRDDNRWLIYLGRIVALAAGIIFVSEIYLTLNYDLNPNELFKRIRTHRIDISWKNLQHDSMQNQPLLQLPYYSLKYDGLEIGTPLFQAQKLGYTECNQNVYYTVCSNPKNDYPPFYNYTVQFAIAEFTKNNELIRLNLYLDKLPSYHAIVTQLAAATHGNKQHTDYVSIAGSHEDILINEEESSIQITNQQKLAEYNKYIHRQKLLTIN